MGDEEKPKKKPRKVVPVRMSEAGIEAIDQAAAELGIDRSEFIRQACSEKIMAHRAARKA